jgi:hypothetical protein
VLAAIGIGASLVLAARMNVREAISMGVLVTLASIQWLATRRGRQLQQGR